jgi:hypothetical protein
MARRTVLSEHFSIFAVSATVKSGSNSFRRAGTSRRTIPFALRNCRARALEDIPRLRKPELRLQEEYLARPAVSTSRGGAGLIHVFLN